MGGPARDANDTLPCPPSFSSRMLGLQTQSTSGLTCFVAFLKPLIVFLSSRRLRVVAARSDLASSCRLRPKETSICRRKIKSPTKSTSLLPSLSCTLHSILAGETAQI